MHTIHPARIQAVRAEGSGKGPVIYWMNRDMRMRDNWALLHAQNIALQQKQPLIVVYNLLTPFLGGADGMTAFKVAGLKELAEELKQKQIGFVVYEGKNSHRDVFTLAEKIDATAVVTDMSPLRIQRKWVNEGREQLKCRFDLVDTHNSIPVWHTSEKQEYAAYTIRPKIHKKLHDWLLDIPSLKKHPHRYTKSLPKFSAQKLVVPYDIIPGEKAAIKTLRAFIRTRLPGYAEKRNDPNEDALSGLSPYFHYGMLSPQRASFEVSASGAHQKDVDAFIEESVVRRELSDNYCWYNAKYDSFEGFPDWAKESLNTHRGDPREYIYTKRQFEKAETHDMLWNAAQTQMVKTGKMHGYMRMYWSKKILEWTTSPEEAQEIAIYLNDTYEIDGRDPNGYVGVAWSIGGVHDRAWPERPVFGKVRYMNFNGCKRKFDVEKYMQEHLGKQQTLV